MFSRSKLFAAVAASTFGALVAFFPGTAGATVLTSCGNIDLSGTETCTLETSGGCTAQCTPVNLDVACSAQLEVSCSGGCTATVDANCSATCVSSCTGGCQANPNFSCSASCDADCSGHCSSQCSSDANSAECTASCKETCGAHCNASCTGAPVTCTPASCQAACQGSCKAQANFSCDISCQEKGYASCTASLQGGCQAQCSQPSGSLFCNGQWVNVDESQLQACESELQAALNIQVSASGSCTGNTCQGKAAASCGQIAPGAMPMSEGFLAVGLGAGIIGAVRRRVRKAKKA